MDQGTEGKAILKTAINQSIHQSIQLISGFNGSIGPNHKKKINQSINNKSNQMSPSLQIRNLATTEGV